MSEKDLDCSMNPYQEEQKPKGYIKQLQWDMAIGLQQVDNLKPSKYLEQISEKNILGELTIKEVEQSLKEYLQTKAGKIIGTLVWIFMFFFTLLFTSYVFQEFTHFIQIEYLSKTPRIFILFASPVTPPWPTGWKCCC